MTEPFLIKGGSAVDDRGIIRFVNEHNFNEVKRFYQIENHSNGFIRAWHGHVHEAKYFFVNSGTSLIGAVNMSNEKMYKFILSSENPSILYIPPGYANGLKNLVSNTIITVYSTSTLEQSKNDDIRFPFDKWNIWNIDYR